MQEVIRKIKESLKQDNKIMIDESAIEIREDNYLPLVPNKKDICCVDGGSAPIIEFPGFAAYFIRIATITTEPWTRKVKEGFAIVKSINSNGKWEYVIDCDVAKIEPVDFYDPELKVGKRRVEISGVIDLLRTKAEIDELALLSGIKIRDGDLQLHSSLLKNFDKNIVGVSKTSKLLSGSGGSASSCFNKKGIWYYPAAQGIGFARLHDKSKHIFRIDSSSHEKAVSALNVLAAYCDDPAFIGYPYPLIKADAFARVTHKEQEFWKARITAALGKELEPHINSLNAHEMLDRLY